MIEFLRENKLLATFILFLLMFCCLMIAKPSFAFDRHGCIKDFGLGYTNKTVLPIWILVIIFSIISYFVISII